MAITDTNAGNQAYYDWSGAGGAANWVKKDESAFDSDWPSSPQGKGISLAYHIVANVFGLSTQGMAGSYLPGYDVKNRDAYQMVQLSLAAEMSHGLLVECYASAEGQVRFYPIGESSSDISNEILYRIRSGELKQLVDNVLVVGYDPPPKKYTGSSQNMFTMGSLHVVDGTTLDTTRTFPHRVAFGDILGPAACDYDKKGTIEFLDPGANDAEKMGGDGGVYSRKSFEELIGWIYHINVPWLEAGSTTMQYQNKSPRYHTLKGFGTLQTRTYKSNYSPALCNQADSAKSGNGVDLPESDKTQFLGVREVYIYGYELTEIGIHETISDDLTTITTTDKFKVKLDTRQNEPIRLTQGQDYIVVPPKSGGASGKYKIVFSANMSPNYLARFGKDLGNVTCVISPSSVLVSDVPVDADFHSTSTDGGKLKDGITEAKGNEEFKAAIFPMGEGNSGYALEKGNEKGEGAGKIVVVYDWDNPCIAFTDLRNVVTAINLAAVSVTMYPIIVKDEPPPIAHNREGLLDAGTSIADKDPSTVQDLDGNSYQMALNSLENGDVKITLPFLDKHELQPVAEFIYEMQSEVIDSTTYICAPGAEPVLGEILGGGVINSISYSYQDSSQYLISVQTGPIWQGMGGWDQSVYQNKTERIQLEGVIRATTPDDSECLVSLERIGMMTCVNGQNQPLEVGDTVKVTVYNNPVSI